MQLLQVFITSVLLTILPVASFLEQREKLMGQLREATETAQAAARAKAEFMAVISHEIRTPMTGVLGMADLLLGADLPVREREYAAGIERSGRHLLALLNDILDFSRGKAKKLRSGSHRFRPGRNHRAGALSAGAAGGRTRVGAAV